MLVGRDAACQEDRDAFWKLVNPHVKRFRQDNPFLETCFREYLPGLPADCFCEGVLDFVRGILLPLVNDASSIILDDDDSDNGALEQLWRIILSAPPQTIERLAINTPGQRHLHREQVDAVVSSPPRPQGSPGSSQQVPETAILGRREAEVFQQRPHRPRQRRSYVAVDTEAQLHEQELLFVRSLTVLREFHRLYRAKAHFAAPDLRSLIQQDPNDVAGDSAELKFQSFDGDFQDRGKAPEHWQTQYGSIPASKPQGSHRLRKLSDVLPGPSLCAPRERYLQVS